jgi:putative ABC transport system permease protein
MRPPGIIEWLLVRLCQHRYLEEILGDLREQYEINIVEKGRRKANRIYIINGLKFINLRTLKNSFIKTNNAMLKNYIIIAIRNLFREKLYSGINIGGLAIGIACSVLLGLYVYTELSFDKFHENAERIVVAHLEYDMGNGAKGTAPVTPTALLPTMSRLMPEVNRGARIFYPSMFKPLVVAKDKQAFQEKDFCYADSTFFKIFTFDFIEGQRETALADLSSLVITEKTREKYFGDEQALGETLTIDGDEFVISGVIRNVPATSSIKFDLLAPFSAYWKRDPIWGSANYLTVLELNKPVESEILSSKIQTELIRLGISDPENGRNVGIGFTPLLDIHLYSEVFEGGDINNLYVFGSIALLILLIAIINYANLATARSFYRAKEVGLRKSLGAYRSSVLNQIIGESFVTSMIAMIIALLLVYFLLPVFGSVTGSVLTFNDLLKVELLLSILVLYIFISVLSGIYPAIKMAAFQPVDILKGQYKGSGEGIVLRKVLISIQFVISISLIIATVVIYNQLTFIQNKDLGYNKENTVVVPVSIPILEQEAQFKNLVQRNSNVIVASIVGETPPNIQGGYTVTTDGENSLGVVAAAIDESFIETARLTLVAGSNISENDLQRTRELKEYSFILNEAAVKHLGFTADQAINAEIVLNGRKGKIKGVVRNFHFRALYEEVAPLVLFTETKRAYNYTLIRINGENIAETIQNIGTAWETIDPASPFSYSFLDQEFNELHVNATRSGELITTFSILAVLIASLGLFGIVSFSMVQRAKEIGVRKVLGASTFSVLMLANKEFLILILVSFLVSAPVAYWAMNSWLNGFAYHVEIGILPVVLGLVFTLLIALLTISAESLKAALLNPADVLRRE